MSKLKHFCVTGNAKAFFITGAMLALGGAFLFCLHDYNIWGYYTAIQVLGWYGFLQAGINLYRWISKPEIKEPRTYEEWAADCGKH